MSDTLTLNGLAKLHPRCDANREVRIKLAEQIADQQARIAELESQVVAFARQKILDGRRIAELEDEVAMLIHPHDLAAYRAKKSLHK